MGNKPAKATKAEALVEQAAALKRAGDYAGALAGLEEAVTAAPVTGDTLAMLLHLYVAHRAVAAGISFMTKIVAVQPQPVWALMGLGTLHAENGTLPQAFEYFKMAAAAAPRHFPARLQMAFVLMKLGRYNEAVEIATACLDLPLSDREKFQIYECVQDVGLLSDLTYATPPPFPRPGMLRRLMGNRPRDDWEAAAIAAIKSQIDVITSDAPTLVFFHLDIGDRHPFLDAEASTGTVDYAGLLLRSCEMARRANPRSTILILTNAATNLSALEGVARCIRLEMPANQLMYTRMRSVRALVAAKRVRGPILFLDTDILLNRDFTPLFDGSFDVGLTSRHEPNFALMPVNEGVILGADGSSDKVAQFFADALHLYEWMANLPCTSTRYGFDIRNWRGGQLSLGALVQRLVPPHAPATAIINDVRYRFFPCGEFNHPVSRHDDMHYLAQKWAVHFKGKSAKALAADYQAYLKG